MVSIPVGLRILLIVGALIALIFVIYSSVKARMNVRYAILWITWGLFILLVGIFPDIAYVLSQLVGFVNVTNFIFLVMIALLFFFNYYMYMRSSHMAQEIKQLNYEVAVLKQERDQKKEEK